MDLLMLIASRQAARDGLAAQRDALGQEGEQILAAATADNNRTSLTPEESTRHLEIVGQRASLQTQIVAADAALAALRAEQDDEARLVLAGTQRTPVDGVPAGGALRTVERPTGTYTRDGSRSFFRDVYRAKRHGDRDALERLEINNTELEVRAISTAAGAGGEFAPPGWMMDDFVTLARPGRIFANEVVNKPLPSGIDSINIPRLTAGTEVDEQSGENEDLEEEDITTDAITAAIDTLGGTATASLQLVTQSPMNIDDILLQDLAEDYARRLNLFCLTNNATNKWGVFNVSGSNAVTYTDASPTFPEFQPKAISAAGKIATNRHLPAQKMFMHTDMWSWILAAQDPAGRPLVMPVGAMANNPAATSEGLVADGLMGYLVANSLPVYGDSLIPTNSGSGTNESHAVVARTSDIRLYEGTQKAEAFDQTLAKQMSVVFRLYNFVAFLANRYPKSISVISGTGTIVPAL